MRLSLLRCVIRRDPTSKHWENWTGRKVKPKEELWTKFSMPGLLLNSLFRKYFPNSHGNRSVETNVKVSLAFSLFYVCIAGTIVGYLWDSYKKAMIKQYETEQKDVYIHRLNTDKDKIYGGKTNFKTINISWDKGIEVEDVTDKVKETQLRADAGQNLEEDKIDPDYDPYKDEVYVRRRLRISHDDKDFDPEWGGIILKRRDKRANFGAWKDRLGSQ